MDGQRQARPLCEKRIVLLQAPNALEAVRKAKRYGRGHQLSYRNADGRRFRIRFLGLVDVLPLEHGQADEVYYSLFRTSRPARYLRDESRFAALRSGPSTIRSSWWAVPAGLARPVRQKGRRDVVSSSALEQTAGSHSLAAAADRECSAAKIPATGAKGQCTGFRGIWI